MKEWRKMPSDWLTKEDQCPLADMKWVGENKADQIAALMLYIIFVHHRNDNETTNAQQLGQCSLTYTYLSDISGVSRAKIAGGIKILIQLDLITEVGIGRNNIYEVKNHDVFSGWAKLPARGLYGKNQKRISAFQNFHLRVKNELNALKIYLLVVAFRSNDLNNTKISYDKISTYTGIHRNEIKSAISLLINLNMLQVDSVDSDINKYSTANVYRLCYLEPYKHRGTTTKELEALS